MLPVKTYTQEQITLYFVQNICDRLESQYGSLAKFTERLESFKANLEQNKEKYNINPYSDKIQQGIYILAKNNAELEIFPSFKNSKYLFIS
jgi:hypothetical protein